MAAATRQAGSSSASPASSSPSSCCCSALGLWSRRADGGVGRSLEAVRAMQSAPPAQVKAEVEPPFGTRVGQPLLHRLALIGRRLDPTGQINGLRRRLDLAGNPYGWDVDRLLAFKTVGILVGLLVGIAVGLALGWSLGPLLAVVLGVSRPRLVRPGPGALPGLLRPDRADAARAARTPSTCSRSRSSPGSPSTAALAQVARNSEGPLADEFFRVLQEMQIGVGRTEAIRAMGDRTDLSDLRQFASAMVQADAFGIPIANVLRVQAREMRIKRSPAGGGAGPEGAGEDPVPVDLLHLPDAHGRHPGAVHRHDRQDLVRRRRLTPPPLAGGEVRRGQTPSATGKIASATRPWASRWTLAAASASGASTRQKIFPCSSSTQ